MRDREYVACGVCGDSAHSPFREEAGYTIVRCAGCGVRYLNPRPGAAELATFYGESYFHSADAVSTGYANYAELARTWRATFRDRLRAIPQGRRLLDVGAAAGFFVEQARLAGWDAIGIEPSEWASAYARDTLSVPVETGTLIERHYPDSSFDVVTLWEVIEHLDDPRTCVNDIARILKSGGHLVLSTPDAGAWATRLSGSAWLGWRKVPEHLYFFEKRHLVRMLEEAGFTVVGSRYVSITVQLGYALERLGALLGMPWLAAVPVWLASVAVPINPLYDLMLTAQKR